MKISKTFSLEGEILIKFIGHCQEYKVDHNKVLENIMNDYNTKQLKSSQIGKPTLLTCGCGCEYSSVLGKCPTCNKEVI